MYMIIAVDFEGVIYDPKADKEVHGAVAALRRLHDKGHSIILWSSQSERQLLWAINWMLKKGIPLNGINVPALGEIKSVDVSPRKIQADVYIESKVVGGFPGWQKVEEYIESLTVQRRCGIDV